MDKNKTYLEEAFKALEDLSLTEDVFELTTDGLEDADNFMNMDFDEVEDIIDVDAKNEEELKDSYIGNVILDCNVCHSKLYKKPEEVIIDEETEVANIEEVCPYCQSNDGYLVIGQVAEYCDHCEDEEEHKEEKVEDSDEIKVDETEEDKVEIEEKEDEKLEENLNEFFEPVDSFKEFTFIDKTKQGFEIKKVYKDLRDNRMHIIAYRPKMNDFLIGLGYSPEDGTWNQGKYDFKSLEDAIKSLKADYKVEEYSHKNESCSPVKAVKESTTRDKIDADADNKKELARKRFVKAKDDADSDRDYKLKKHDLKESDKPAAVSIEDAQKWVDYDMKKYGRISDRTNRLVKKAGFQILKDDHGDYEVAAGKFESCNEDFERVDIETDREKMSMTADEDGKVTVTTEPKEEIKEEEKEEVIEPVSDEVKAEFKTTEEENKEDEYADIDIDEFDEEEFDSLGEQYLKRVYENVKSFKTTKGSVNGNNLKLEGIITFKSGKEAKTNFVFESKTVTKTGKLKFIGENKQFAKGKKSFTLTGRMDGNKLVTESFTYNYKTKDPKSGEMKKLYGRVVR